MPAGPAHSSWICYAANMIAPAQKCQEMIAAADKQRRLVGESREAGRVHLRALQVAEAGAWDQLGHGGSRAGEGDAMARCPQLSRDRPQAGGQAKVTGSK